MSNNYSEQIFQSIDTIISQRLNEVSFDKTEVCEIISIDEKIINKYLVSNGSLKYEAYSDDENRKYLVGSKVYVRINNGNYGLKKIITGSYTADEIPKNLYTNPFNHLVVSSKYNWITEANKLSAIAYKDKTTDQDPYLSNDLTFYYSGLGQFNYIGLEFAATTGFGGTTGEFQIIVDLLDSDGKSLLSEAQLGLLTLSSKQLYGNPYYLNGNLKFQHLFNFPVGNFSDLTKVKKVKITLVTKGNFNYIGENNLAVVINDLTIFFGFDSSENEMSENKVALVLDNTRSLEYTTANDKKQMSIDWRDLNSGAIYNETPNMQYPEAGKYNIYWLQYSESIGYAKKLEADGGIDIEESGTYWKTVKRTDAATTGAYTYTLSPSADWKKEQIKVIIKKVGTNDYVESKGLTFTNTEFRTETGSNKGKADTLRLTLAEGDDGVYNSYGIDNKLLASYNLTHSLTVDYVDNNKWDWNPSIQKVIWKIPAKATMIKHPGDGWRLENNFYIYDSNPDLKTINFNLSEQFSYNKTNNTIYCEIIRYKHPNSTEIENDEYQGSITLQFGLQGTAGTGWAFNIVQSQRALSTPGNNKNTMSLTATLENADGEPIDENSWKDSVEWSWYQTEYGSSESSKRYSMSNTKGKSIQITRNDFLDDYAIIQAKLTNWQDKNGNKINLTAYLPIAAGEPSHYLTGASRVVYNNQGTTPSYDEDPYALYNSSHELVNEQYTYNIVSLETNKNNCFTINLNEGNLKPLSFLPTKIPKMALKVYGTDGKIKYVQPILVLKNGYQSKLINEWDGSLKVDANNNTILSSLIGAGKKDKNNLFTGVILGVANNFNLGARTGLYGYQNGEVRFAFDENGAFYVGKGSDNFISFNEGVTGRSSSGELLIKTQKFILNAGKLSINSTVSGSNAVINFNNKFILNADGTALIGGWTIENNRIENIKTEDKHFYINVNPTSGTYKAWIAAGKYDSKNKKWNWPFYVDRNGILYASGANIEGKFAINANSTIKDNNGNDTNITTTVFTTIPGKISAAISESKTYTDNTKTTLEGTITATASKLTSEYKKAIENSEGKITDAYTTAISQSATSVTATAKQYTDGQISSLSSIYLKASEIGAYVKKQDGNSTKTFGWKMTSDEFTIYTGSKNIFQVKSDNTAQIAGWIITSDSISKGTTSLSATDTNGKITTSNIEINGGNMNINNAFLVNSSGRVSIVSLDEYGNVASGYLTFGGTKYHHPYVSALNVGWQGKGSENGGISFRNSDNIDSAGGQIGKVQCNSSRMMISHDSNVIIASAIGSSNYVRTNWNYNCSKETKYSNGTQWEYWLSFGYSAYSSPPRIKASQWINSKNESSFNLYLFSGGGKTYCGGDTADYYIKTKGATPSSLNVKTNLLSLEEEYDILYSELNKIQAYTFDYKYKNVNGDLTKDYGFIIDEIEAQPHLSQYFFNYDTQRVVKNNTLYPLESDNVEQKKLPKINIKVWDTDSYIKGLFVMVKTLQNKINLLQKEIKEIKQYET